jgi:hypothetical protein
MLVPRELGRLLLSSAKEKRIMIPKLRRLTLYMVELIKDCCIIVMGIIIQGTTLFGLIPAQKCLRPEKDIWS